METGFNANEVIFQADDICKRFVSVRALNHVHLKIHRGEVHALLGQNGAGKSTLVKIIAGAEYPDSGQLIVNGEPLRAGDPDAAIGHHIAYVSQEGSLNPGFTVPENVFLGREKTKFGLLDRRRMRQEVEQVLREFGLSLDLRSEVGALDPAKRKLAEIVRALALGPQLLILDEPTAALPQPDVDHLLMMIRQLARTGIGVLFISHYLKEIFAVASTATVLRDGELVWSGSLASTTADQLVRYMIGKDTDAVVPPRRTVAAGAPAIEVHGLATRDGRVRQADLAAYAGRILGIFGVVGAGKSELLEAMFGIRPTATGTINLGGRTANRWGPRRAIGAGMALVPEDRLSKALLATRSIAWNVAMPYWETLNSRFSIGRREASLGREVIADLGIQAPGAQTLVEHLSGGNKQKVSIGRWLGGHASARIFLFDEPTQGLDVGARAGVYRLMRDLAETGATIIVASSDLEEVLAISDDVIVIRNGTTTTLDENESREAAAVLGAAT
jgi:ABC-type sugar transport system ATPase subunit